MTNTQEKIYIKGSKCKEIKGKFGPFYNISFKIEDLQEHANEKGYINLVMSKRKEVGQFGDTHSFTLNTRKPEEKKEESVSKDLKEEDLPWNN